MTSRPDRPLAVVTGASRGIGLAIASALAPDHRLILVGRDHTTLAAAATHLRDAGAAEVSTHATDLADPRARAQLIGVFRGLDPGVQVLVNNAGVAPSAALTDTDDALWNRVVELNLTAAFALCRALVPAMAARGWGRVVNIASTAALKGYRYTAAYCASKAGLLGLTRALAAEFVTSGVTVNAVCPGFTDTEVVHRAVRNISEKTGRSPSDALRSLERFSPMQRLVMPAEVAATVAHLCGDASAIITGQAVALDGGESTL